jgi:hypothetical protein
MGEGLVREVDSKQLILRVIGHEGRSMTFVLSSGSFRRLEKNWRGI